MCLAIPLQIEKIDGSQAVVVLNGSSVDVSLAVVPEASVGDWVLVHAGMAITLLDEAEAMETYEILSQAMGIEPPRGMGGENETDG